MPPPFCDGGSNTYWKIRRSSAPSAATANTGIAAPVERVEAADLVHAHHVIGMTVGHQDRVHPPDAEGERLLAQVRGGVHQHAGAAVHLQIDRRAAAAGRAGPSDRHTSHVQPIIGTPCDVPLPRIVSQRLPNHRMIAFRPCRSRLAPASIGSWPSCTCCADPTAARGTASRRCSRCVRSCSRRPRELLDALDDGRHAGVQGRAGRFPVRGGVPGGALRRSRALHHRRFGPERHRQAVRRHPHVFTPDGEPLPKNTTITASGVKAQWDDIKAGERSAAGKPQQDHARWHPAFAAGPAARRSSWAAKAARSASTGSSQPTCSTRSTKRCASCARRCADPAGLGPRRRRARRPAVRPRQPRPQDGHRARDRAAESQRQVPAPLRVDGATATAEGHALKDLSFDDLDQRWNDAKKATADQS